MTRNAFIFSLVVVVGCVQPHIEMDVGGESGGSTTWTPGVPDDESEEPERPPSVEEGDGDGGDSHVSAGFIQDPDGGDVAIQCDVWEQDCPDGEKCNYWANDGGGAWNATKCVPLDPDPDGFGEPCTVVGSGVSGVDSCVLGSMCWDVDPETNEGECVAFCTGSEANPTCPDPTMHCTGRDLVLCLPSCCPLLQDCNEGQACYPNSHSFDCAPDVSGDGGGFGDVCEFINVCDPGLLCANPELVEGCEGASCCTPFCDHSDPNACAGLPPSMECIAWFEEGHAPPGEENVGFCAVPA